jgi:pimeloyl-ACP methyl ester carboxylesterase
MLRKAGLLTHYWFHFQEPGVAEAEFERDPRAALRRVLYSISGDAPAETKRLTLQPGKGWLANTLDPEHLPAWLTDADLDHMAAEYSRSGFRGGLNWYRNIDRNWELTAPWAGASIRQPALFIAGSEDPIISGGAGAAAVQALPVTVPGLTRTLFVTGAGHFIQQERAQLVSEAIVEFLSGLAEWECANG